MEALSALGINLRDLILYLVNFGILLLLMAKFLYKPLMKVIDDRRDNIKRNLEEAETLKRTFQEENEKREAEKEQFARQMQQEVADAKRLGSEKAETLLTEAEARKAELIDEAREVINEMKSRIQSDVEADVRARMEQVILHVLRNEVPAEAVRKSINTAWEELRA